MKNSLLTRFDLPYNEFSKSLIIGIDFGDGEYAAAQAKLNEIKKDGKVIVTDLDMQERIKVNNLKDFTDFAVYGHKIRDARMTSEGVGKSYVVQDTVKNNSFASFKRRPGKGPGTSSELYSTGAKKTLTGYTYEYLMSHAFRCLVDSILRENEFLDDRDTSKKHVYLFVGRPSSARWEETELAYAKLLAKNLKTYPNVAFHVAVVSEAKAAMASEYYQHRKQSKTKHSNMDIQKETIAIIDGGSSTFDCVVVRDGRVICEYSRQIGAGKLDQNLLDIPLFRDETVEACVARLDPILWESIPAEEAATLVTEASVTTRGILRDAMFVQQDAKGKLRLDDGIGKTLITLREAKESYFGPSGDDGDSNKPYSIYYGNASGTGRPETLTLQFRYDLEQAVSHMSVTVEASYSEKDPFNGHEDMEYPSFEAALEAFFKGARATWERSGVKKPDRVIVTGGATLMPFVNQIMNRVFETVKQKIAVSPPTGNRHYSVSTGVAYIGFVELYKEKIYREVCKKCDGFVDGMKDELKSALLCSTTNYEWDDCLSWVDTWVNSAACTTLDDINMLPHDPPEKTWSERVQKEMENCIRGSLSGKVQVYLKDKTAKMFPNAKAFHFKLDVVSLSKVDCTKPVLHFSSDLFRSQELGDRLAQRFLGVPLLSSSRHMDKSAKKLIAKNVRSNESQFRSSIQNQLPDLSSQADAAAKQIKEKLRKQMESYVEQMDDFFIREDFKQKQ